MQPHVKNCWTIVSGIGLSTELFLNFILFCVSRGQMHFLRTCSTVKYSKIAALAVIEDSNSLVKPEVLYNKKGQMIKADHKECLHHQINCICGWWSARTWRHDTKAAPKSEKTQEMDRYPHTDCDAIRCFIRWWWRWVDAAIQSIVLITLLLQAPSRLDYVKCGPIVRSLLLLEFLVRLPSSNWCTLLEDCGETCKCIRASAA